MLPALFVSHGAPTLVLDDVPARDFLRGLPDRLGEKPRAILVVSAHWETTRPIVNAVARNETIYDFRGFPQALYEMSYPAPGAPDLAQAIVAHMAEAGIEAGVDQRRGLDHGAWVPLILAWPDADIPVLQLSVQPHQGPVWHHRLGQALSGLRAQGVLIVASGSLTHNLGAFRGAASLHAPAEEWVSAFADWMAQKIAAQDLPALMDYRAQAPFAVDNHPTDEHLLPLFVALGAGGTKGARRIHRSTTFGILAMDAYQFGDG